MLVLAMTIPPRPRPASRKISVKDVKSAIQQAKNLCYNFEDTPACRLAWSEVEEISTALARQEERELLKKKNLDELCIEDPAACKEYDV
jgi:hypothetical protein